MFVFNIQTIPETMNVAEYIRINFWVSHSLYASTKSQAHILCMKKLFNIIHEEFSARAEFQAS
jgi:hypothetical protein